MPNELHMGARVLNRGGGKRDIKNKTSTSITRHNIIRFQEATIQHDYVESEAQRIRHRLTYLSNQWPLSYLIPPDPI